MSSRAPKIEIASTDHPARPKTELARALWRAAICMLAVLPMGMAVAHRSSPVFLGLAAVLAILATLSEGRLGELAGEARKHLVTPLGIAALSFFGWTFISIAWSEFPVTSLRALGEFWLSVAFAVVLAISLPARVTRSAFLLLAISCTLAALMMLVELHTGMSLRRALQVRSNTFIFNRPMLTLLVLLPVVAAFLLRGGRAGGIAAAGLTCLAVFAIARSESGAAVLGLFAAILVFILGWLAPRLMTVVAAIAFIATFALAPFLGPIGDRLIPASVHERLANDHSRDRIDIWLSFGDAIRLEPVLGAGFGISTIMNRTSIAGKVVPEHRELLGVGHPHNAAIQVWTELGIVGVVFTLMIILQVLRAISRQRRVVAAASLALLAGASAVALVGHGAWQGWWAASLAAAIVWLLALRRTELETTR